ncbi:MULTISPECIES: MotA/TolQ/ExbB proton channel family protein [Modicisalibacter]|uniref:MotA/TolQ/ExbB proton channel family protein n=1 Tax=Modicisalibacter TaxID=574347 RepID=UPI00100A4DFA|nr:MULTISPECIES: MotA/TolQ/ExbB proton channel family protein [Halomonadaceae]MBZ9556575.1 MotA/TolQ/ExbB proton channel family protein [Modicisalibacter sp. R2A 31.J]MBZ9574956.1 MotA/TolQ/ExbB proton channel family protein [Modicisalibacter sp. MOD 31.J]
MWPLLEPLDRLIEAGGVVLVVIAVVAMALFSLALERGLYWRFGHRRARHELIERWAARHDHVSWSALTLREVWTRELIARLRHPLPWLKLLVALCPLLGLLGTVTGMIQVFDSLALTEVGQARAMADGVARATLPTLTGMAVAVVGLLFVTRLEQVIRREDQRLHDRMARAVEENDA